MLGETLRLGEILFGFILVYGSSEFIANVPLSIAVEYTTLSERVRVNRFY